mgnify:FL=1
MTTKRHCAPMSDDFDGGTAEEYAATTSFNTTGQLTWPAARRLARFLESTTEWRGGDDARGRPRALELGSGNGWLGCALARRGAVERVVLTEMVSGGALAWLRRRIRANLTREEDANRVRCRALDWTDVDGAVEDDDEEDADAREEDLKSFDAILGADLVYEDAGVKMLPRVVAALLAGNAKRRDAAFWYAHTKHRYDGMDLDFFEEIRACGLRIEEVREDGAPSPPPSPPPFESLFPEQRIAIYRIELDVSSRAASSRE